MTLLSCLLISISAMAQNETTSVAIVGSCIEPDSNLVTLFFDYSKNCPEADPNGDLAGTERLGFHSGINNWATIVRFDDEGAMAMENLGNDIYMVKVNTMDYYGAPLSDITQIDFVLPNLDFDDPWAISCRDERDGGGFGGTDPCSNFIFLIDSAPICSELAQESSTSLFGATTSASSCVDTTNGTVTLEFDLSLNCPEADPNNLLAGAAELGFHSGANNYEVQVNWDDANALTAVNDSNDIFSLTLNVSDYYGIPLSDLENIQFVLNNGPADPGNPWEVAGRDERDGGFGGTEPCSDLILILSEAPVCPQEPEEPEEPEMLTSRALLLDEQGETRTGDAASLTCADPNTGRVQIGFDLALNCPEADTANVLAGMPVLGFHSGANNWMDGTVTWDDSTALQATNNGSDIFTVTVDVMAYYGIEYDSLQNIEFLLNNGPADPENPWDATGKDERDGGGFGGDEPCTNLLVAISEIATCDLRRPDEFKTSQSLISAAAGSCVDTNTGLVRVAFDQSMNCPEADSLSVLDSAMVLGFHSGANNWDAIVTWDAAGAKQAVNEGNNVFSVVVNVEDYYGLPFDSVQNIEFLMNNGVENPEDPWGITGKDPRDGGGFGGNEPCTNLLLEISELPGCDLSETATSHALLNGLAASCVDTSLSLVRIDFDYNLNCPDADVNSLLRDAPAIAFHSGVNSWSAQVPWDDEKAVAATNQGDNLFSLVVNLEDYYGVPMDSVTEINFLYNNGLGDPENPWGDEGKDPRDGMGFGGIEPCTNFLFSLSEAPACDLSTSVQDVRLESSLRVYPNPFSDEVMIEFENPDHKTFELFISNINGKVVRRRTDLNGTQVIVERQDLPAGMYFAHLVDAQGNFAIAKLMIH